MPVTQSNKQYDAHVQMWETVRDCIAGQTQVKRKGVKYLPEFSVKDELRYRAYKQRALFLGVTGRTQASLVGAAMRKEPTIELPTDLEYIRDDADNSGNSIMQLIRLADGNVMAVGRHGLLVDYPSAEGELSVDDVQRLGLRPAIKEYKAETIINWREEAGQLTLVVLKEVYEESDDGFTVTTRDRYRVLRLSEGEYFQEIYDQDGQIVDSSQPRMANGQPWDFIPFVFVGSQNNSPDIDTAPLYDLAVVNIAHYRNSADYEEGVFIHGQPMLHIDLGTMQADQWEKLNPNGIQVGARRGITTSGGGKAALLQAEANSAAFEAMAHKEAQMVKIGARLVEVGGANETAEAVRTNAAAEHSVLASVVVNVGEAIELCLRWCCMFAGSNPDDVSVEVSLEFFDKAPDAQMIAAMMGLEDRGHMTQPDIRAYLRKVGLIADDRTDEDIDADVEEDAGIQSGNDE